MQLDLFVDNRLTILMNDAEALLRNLELKRAIGIYLELRNAYPEDSALYTLYDTVSFWQDQLEQFHAEAVDKEVLNKLWLALSPGTPLSLKLALCEMIIEQLRQLPSCERIFLPPGFHLGNLLMVVGNHSEAERCFARVLDDDVLARGKFLAWQGDALTLLERRSDALHNYCAAFLENPYEVDMVALKNQVVHELFRSLEEEADDYVDMDLCAWLPVWGWLCGKFTLRMNEIIDDSSVFCAGLEEAERTKRWALPRQWFETLRYAEYLRTVSRNDREMVRVRRWLKQQHAFFFDCYMKRIKNLQLCEGGKLF